MVIEPIEVGSTAPNFTLKDNRGEFVTLSDFIGKWVLLSWHPLAWTGVCADQMVSLEKNIDKFEKLKTIPLGMSVDPVPSKNAWAKHLEVSKVKLPSDFWPHGAVAKAYGLFREVEGSSGRANVIIDHNGIVRWTKVYETSQLPDINEVIEWLEKNI